MKYTYRGKSYYLDLSKSGELVCEDLDLRAKDFEQMKKLIADKITRETSVGRTAILTFGGGRFDDDYQLLQFYEGTTTGIPHGEFDDFWVSWVEDGDTERRKMSKGEFCIDTPENRKILAKIIVNRMEINRLKEENLKLDNDLERIKTERKQDG